MCRHPQVLPAGIASNHLTAELLEKCVVIDLGADYRLSDADVYETWYKVKHGSRDLLKNAVYGLCEIYRQRIACSRLLARSVVSSSLVKAAFFGADANWGRILCAMGYSGADFNPEGTELSFSSAKGTIDVVSKGEPIVFNEETAKNILLEKEVSVSAKLNDGEASASAWGCDLSYEYVRINGDYRS